MGEYATKGLIPELRIGHARLGAGMARLPAAAIEAGALNINSALKIAGKPEWQIKAPDSLWNNRIAKFWDEEAARLEKDNSIEPFEEAFASKDPSRIAANVGRQIVRNSPQQVFTLTSAMIGQPGVALALMSAQSGATAMHEGHERGVDPATNAANGILNAAWEGVGEYATLSAFKGMEEALVKSFGKAGARKIMADVAKGLAATVLKEGTGEVVTGVGQDASAVATGYDPRALENTGPKALGNFLVGAGSGLTTTAPASAMTAAGSLRAKRMNDIAALAQQSSEIAPVRVEGPKSVYESIPALKTAVSEAQVNPASASPIHVVLESLGSAIAPEATQTTPDQVSLNVEGVRAIVQTLSQDPTVSQAQLQKVQDVLLRPENLRKITPEGIQAALDTAQSFVSEVGQVGQIEASILNDPTATPEDKAEAQSLLASFKEQEAVQVQDPRPTIDGAMARIQELEAKNHDQQGPDGTVVRNAEPLTVDEVTELESLKQAVATGNVKANPVSVIAQARKTLSEHFSKKVRAERKRAQKQAKAQSVAPQKSVSDIVKTASEIDLSQAKFKKEAAEKNLIAMHNLSQENLLHADKMGGLAVPSLSIGKTTGPLNNFGDITLLGNKDLIDPKRQSNKVFNADIYSPRYPSVRYSTSASQIKKFSDLFSKESDDLKTRFYSEIDSGSFDRKGLDAVRESAVVRLHYLRSIGKDVEIPKKKADTYYLDLSPDLEKYMDRYSIPSDLYKNKGFLAAYKKAQQAEFKKSYDAFIAEGQSEKDAKANAKYVTNGWYEKGGQPNYNVIRGIQENIGSKAEAGEVDYHGARSAIGDALNPRKADFGKWVDKTFAGFIEKEQLRNGYDNNGNTRYLTHTLDNVIRIMKRELQSGEGFNYGIGNLRAANAKRYRSVKEIQADRSKILSSEDFAEAKAVTDQEFEGILSEAYKVSTNKDFGFGDRFVNVLIDAIKHNSLEKDLNEYGFGGMDVDRIRKFLATLRDMPTEYFEAKVQRAVNLNEFSGAIIPKNTSPEARAVLEKHGIQAIEYDPNKEGDKARAIDEFDRTKKEIKFKRESPTRASEPTIQSGEPAGLSARAVAIINDLLPELKGILKFNVIRTPDMQFAVGAYFDDQIALTIKADGSVAYHEVLHAYLDKFVPKTRRLALLSAMDSIWGTKNLDEAEEVGADKFAEYAEEVKAGRSGDAVFPAKADPIKVNSVKTLFARIYQAIKGVLDSRNRAKVKRLYNDILAKKRPRSYRDFLDQPKVKYKKERPSEVKKRIRQITGMVRSEGNLVQEMDALNAAMKKAENASEEANKEAVKLTTKELYELKTGLAETVKEMVSEKLQGEFLKDIARAKDGESIFKIMDKIERLNQEEILDNATVEVSKSTRQIIREATGQTRISDLEKDESEGLAFRLRREAIAAKQAHSVGHKLGKAEVRAHLQELATLKKIRQEMRSGIKKMILSIKDLDLKHMRPEYREAVEDLIEGFDFKKPKGKTARRMRAIQQFLKDNPEADIPQQLADSLSIENVVQAMLAKPIQDLTFFELKDIHDQVMQFKHLNELKNKLINTQRSRTIDEVTQEGVATVEAMKKSEPGNEIKIEAGSRASVMQLIKDFLGIRSMHPSLVIENIFGRNSKVYHYLFTTVNKGYEKTMDYIHKQELNFSEKLNALGHLKDVDKWLKQEVSLQLPSGRKITLPRSKKLSLMMHIRGTSNREALRSGGFVDQKAGSPVIHMTDADMDFILDSSTPEEDTIMNAAADVFAGQIDDLNEVHVRTKGYEVQSVSDYFPVRRRGAGRNAQDIAENDIITLVKDHMVRIGLRKGFLKERVKSKLPVVLYDVDKVIADSVYHAGAYIGLEEPLRDASRILYDQDIKNALNSVFGTEAYRYLDQYLRNMAQDAGDYGVAEDILARSRNAITPAILGLNPFTVAKQMFGLSTYLVYLSPKSVMYAVGDYIHHANKIEERHKKYSVAFRERLRAGFNVDVADVIRRGYARKFRNAKAPLSERMMGGIQWMDQLTVAIGMEAAVNEKLAELEKSNLPAEEKLKLAYAYADEVTANTQQMYQPQMRSAVSRGSGVERMLTWFSSQQNMFFNLMVRTYKEGQRTGDYTKFGKFMVYAMLINSVGMMGVDSLRGFVMGSGDDDDDRTAGEKAFLLFLKLLKEPLGYSYVVRDMADSAISKVENGQFFGRNMSNPMFSTAQQFIDILAGTLRAIKPGKATKDSRIKETKRAVFDMTDLALKTRGIPFRTPARLLDRVWGLVPNAEKQRTEAAQKALKQKRKLKREASEAGRKRLEALVKEGKRPIPTGDGRKDYLTARTMGKLVIQKSGTPIEKLMLTARSDDEQATILSSAAKTMTRNQFGKLIDNLYDNRVISVRIYTLADEYYTKTHPRRKVKDMIDGR